MILTNTYTYKLKGCECMEDVSGKWHGELNSRLEEIKNELKLAREQSAELSVKARISQEAVDYVGTEQNMNEYVKEKYVENFLNQHKESESKVRELLNERRAIEGLIEVIERHK